MHRLDEKILITPDLLRRFDAEAQMDDGDGRFYALAQRSNGAFLEHRMGSRAEPDQVIFAQDLLTMLNKELHHDGAWVIVFTHPKPREHVLASHGDYARFAIMWMDRDGDVQFTHDWLEKQGEIFDFADVLKAGREVWCEHAEQAWKIWHTMMIDVIDPAEGQTFKRAQGQAPHSLH